MLCSGSGGAEGEKGPWSAFGSEDVPRTEDNLVSETISVGRVNTSAGRSGIGSSGSCGLSGEGSRIVSRFEGGGGS